MCAGRRCPPGLQSAFFSAGASFGGRTRDPGAFGRHRRLQPGRGKADSQRIECERCIEKALHRSWYYDPNTIQVSAQGGKITLTGNVTTWNARRLAESTAWSAPGATSVENDIAVT